MRKHIFYNTVNFSRVTFRILFFRGIQTLHMRLSRKACFWWIQLLRPFCRELCYHVQKSVLLYFCRFWEILSQIRVSASLKSHFMHCHGSFLRSLSEKAGQGVVYENSLVRPIITSLMTEYISRGKVKQSDFTDEDWFCLCLSFPR